MTTEEYEATQGARARLLAELPVTERRSLAGVSTAVLEAAAALRSSSCTDQASSQPSGCE